MVQNRPIKNGGQMRAEKKQFNVRLTPGLRRAASSVCDKLGYTRDELGEVAIATLLGTKDPVLRAKRKKISDIAKEYAGTFNGPECRFIGVAA